MDERIPMICTRCGETMNHHADKAIPGDAAAGDVIAELHSCPGCGATASRRAPEP